MKKINLILLLLTFVFSFSLTACNEEENKNNSNEPQYSETVDVIVLAGQSNMEGNSLNSFLLNKTDSSMHQYYNSGFDNTLISYHCGRKSNISKMFVPVKLGQGVNKSMFGPEVGIAEELHNRGYEKTVYIVKYSLGGTSLFYDWNTANESSLYYELMMFLYDRIMEFEEEGIHPVIRGLFWMQGEADACEANLKDNYQLYLSNMVTSFREEFEEYYGVPGKGIAFVDAGISDCSTWRYHEYINQCKQKFADSDPNKNYYFSTMENGLEYHVENNDPYHYDATSELKLGKLFISTLLDNGWL